MKFGCEKKRFRRLEGKSGRRVRGGRKTDGEPKKNRLEPFIPRAMLK